MRSTEEQNILTGIVTCSCNLPPCVLTGYMCKSTLGVCFEDLPPQGHGHGLYGCINNEAHTRRCHQKPSPSENESAQHNENNSRFSCCYKDMCNHADMAIIRREPQGVPQKQYYDGDQHMATNSNDEVLFKVATIAVPICGCVILLLLILLAIKILRTESGFNNNKFGATYCKKHICHNSFSSSPSHNNYQYHDVLLPNNNHKNHPEYHPNHIIESRELLPLPRVIIDPQLSPTVSIDMSKNETHARLNYLNDYSSLMPHKSALLYEKDIQKCYDNVDNNLASSDDRKLDYNQSCPNIGEVARTESSEINECGRKENSGP